MKRTKRIATGLLALTLASAINISALAVDDEPYTEVIDGITYIYVSSEDEIDFENVQPNTAYVVPDSGETKSNSENVGVSVIPPIGDVTRGYKPPTEVWNIDVKGKYSFAGTSGDHPLYTQYRFTGKDFYSMVIHNALDQSRTVDADKPGFFTGSTIKTYKVSAKSTLYCFLDSSDGITSSTEWYLSFGWPSDVDGYVKLLNYKKTQNEYSF